MPSHIRSLLLLLVAGCTGTHSVASPLGGDPSVPGDGAAGTAAQARPDTAVPTGGASGAAAEADAGAPSAREPVAGSAGSGAAGQPAPEVEDPEDDVPTGNGCTPTATRLASIDEVVPAGYSAADILAFASGSHATRIRWLPVDGRVFAATYVPESGEHDLTVDVHYEGGEVRLMRREPDAAGFFDPGAGCRGGQWMEIDVQLEVTSDGGALAEQRSATLRVDNALWVTIVPQDPMREQECTVIAADEFGGSFAVVAATPESYALRDVCLELYVSPAGVVGTMWGTLEDQEANPEEGTATGEVDFARIGASGCDRVGGAPIALDDDRFGATGQSVLELIESVPAADGTWQDGTRTELQFSIEHGDGPACTAIRSTSGPLQLESRLRITSADGRIDATWPVDVLVESPTPDPEVQVSLPEELAFEELGIAGVDASGYELISAYAWFTVVSTPSGAELSGGLEIYGLAQVDCPLPPPGAPPCPERELIDWISWTAP